MSGVLIATPAVRNYCILKNATIYSLNVQVRQHLQGVWEEHHQKFQMVRALKWERPVVMVIVATSGRLGRMFPRTLVLCDWKVCFFRVFLKKLGGMS